MKKDRYALVCAHCGQPAQLQLHLPGKLEGETPESFDWGEEMRRRTMILTHEQASKVWLDDDGSLRTRGEYKGSRFESRVDRPPTNIFLSAEETR